MQIIKSILRPLPKIVFLEPTFGCNFKCRFCHLASLPNLKFIFMGPKVFNKIKPILTNIEYVHLAGWGEPLLNPYCTNIFSYFQKNDIRYYIISNGSVIRDRDLKIFGKSCTRLGISLDAGDSSAYNQIRINGNWEKVLDNLFRVSHYKKKHALRFPELELRFHINTENIDSILKIPSLAKKLHVDNLTFKWTGVSPKYHYLSAKHNQSQIEPKMKALVKHCESLNIPYTSTATFTSRKTLQCWGSDNVYTTIGACGTVVSCCYGWIPIGNLYQNNFLSIWNSHEMRQLHLGLKNGTLYPKCFNCLAITATCKISEPSVQSLKTHDYIKEHGSYALPVLPKITKALENQFQKSNSQIFEKRLDTAIKRLLKQVEKYPDFYEFKNNLAVAYFVKKDYASAKNILNRITNPYLKILVEKNKKEIDNERIAKSSVME